MDNLLNTNEVLERATILMNEHIGFRSITDKMKYTSLANYLSDVEGVYSPRMNRILFQWEDPDSGLSVMGCIIIPINKLGYLINHAVRNYSSIEDDIVLHKLPYEKKEFEEFQNIDDIVQIYKRDTAEYQTLLAEMSHDLIYGKAIFTDAIYMESRKILKEKLKEQKVS